MCVYGMKQTPRKAAMKWPHLFEPSFVKTDLKNYKEIHTFSDR